MSVPTHNYEWEQGADLDVVFVYKTNTNGVVTPVDLTVTGYAVRMDIATDLGARLYTFNSADIPDVDGSGVGTEGDTTKEAVLSADGTVTISVPRSLTLPGGAIYVQMQSGKTVFMFDVILRKPSGKQEKLYSGQVTVNKSVTLWE